MAAFAEPCQIINYLATDIVVKIIFKIAVENNIIIIVVVEYASQIMPMPEPVVLIPP